MSDDLKPEMLKATQTLLSKFIKKPPLTDKLLKKPPFRYLHDIVTSIIKDTGFLKGLYTPEEMIVDNNLDKAGKIAFLDKLISAVKVATGANLTVKSSKIVSGLEVTKTHELLQEIGHALEKKVDSKNAVEEVLKKGLRKSGKESNKSKNKEDDNSKRKSSNDTPKQVEDHNPDSLSPKSSMETIERKKGFSSASSTKENIQQNNQVTENGEDQNSKVEPEEKVTSQETNFIEHDPKDHSKAPLENTISDQGMADSAQTNSSRKAEKSPRERRDKKLSEEKKSSPRGEKKSSPREDRKTSREQKSAKGDESSPREEKKTPPDKSKSGREGSAKTSGETKKCAPQIGNDSGVKPPGKSPKKSPTVKDKRDEKSSSGKENRIEKELSGKDKDREGKPDKNNISGVTKKDSRPTSARPGSRKPLKATPPGPPAAATTAAAPGVKRPTSAMKRPPSAGPRPPSARPAPPRVRDRGEVVREEEAGGGVPVNLIKEKGKGEDEEEMVTVETVQIENQRKQSLTSADDQENQGQLVSQILETQKEFEDGMEPEVLRRTQIEWEGARRRGREAAAKDIQKLKDCVQVITRCAHPLSKLMDFYQEDVEEIERELSKWKSRSNELRKQLTLEREKTIESIEPLKLQLEELDKKIDKEIEQVALMKMKVLKNDQRIRKLLESGRGG